MTPEQEKKIAQAFEQARQDDDIPEEIKLEMPEEEILIHVERRVRNAIDDMARDWQLNSRKNGTNLTFEQCQDEMRKIAQDLENKGGIQ